ncbi:MAG: endonuclease/exonuclease/phosphatase family protein [Candidatus Caenarcaniphilales bacterium]|nr:endonuclease/exonuclease/phosphatase family protein [Candidatus Caenarcaniphilales bacterium]
MLFYLYIFSASALLIAGYLFGDNYWWLGLINSFRYWLFAPLVIFWIEHLWVGIEKIPGAFMLLLTGLFIFLYVWFPFYEDFLDKKDVEFVGKPIRVMTFNVFFENKNYSSIVEAIREGDPDVVALQETTPKTIQILEEKLQRDYPHKSFNSGSNIAGIATFSKYPIEQRVSIPVKVGSAELVSLRNPNRNIILVNVHTESIDPLDVFGGEEKILKAYKNREVMLKHVIHYLNSHSIPLRNTIILGDFNSTEGNQLYKIMKKEGFTDSYRKVNAILPYAFTFPNNMKGLLKRPAKFWPLIRLDYIYVGERYKPLEAKVINTETGSDHKPVVSELGLL